VTIGVVYAPRSLNQTAYTARNNPSETRDGDPSGGFLGFPLDGGDGAPYVTSPPVVASSDYIRYERPSELKDGDRSGGEQHESLERGGVDR